MRVLALAVIGLMGWGFSPAVWAEESQADDWGLTNAELARIDGKVVDILCDLSGDCPASCGNGARQLGILSDEAGLVYVAKNNQGSFNGAVEDLLPYCGKNIEADGVMTGHTGITFYHVQFIRETGASQWQKTTRWTKAWDANHPDLAAIKGPWFRKDPRILSMIEESGYFGIGLDVDQAYIEEWQ